MKNFAFFQVYFKSVFYNICIRMKKFKEVCSVK